MLTPIEKRQIVEQIKPLAFQKVYFSFIKYGEFLPTWEQNSPLAIGKDFYFDRRYAILLLCGIADPQPLYSYLKENVKTVDLIPVSRSPRLYHTGYGKGEEGVR